MDTTFQEVVSAAVTSMVTQRHMKFIEYSAMIMMTLDWAHANIYISC